MRSPAAEDSRRLKRYSDVRNIDRGKGLRERRGEISGVILAEEMTAELMNRKVRGDVRRLATRRTVRKEREMATAGPDVKIDVFIR